MEPGKAFEVAGQLVESGVDVVVEVRHPGLIEETNAQGPPEATVRVISGAGIPEGGLPRGVLEQLLEADEAASIATSDLVVG